MVSLSALQKQSTHVMANTGGVFIQDSSNIPAYVEWPKYLSFYNFAFEIEFHGLVFTIDDATVTVNGFELSTSGLDVSLTGDFFIGFFGFDKNDVREDYVFLVVWGVVYLLLGYLALTFLHRSKR